MEASAPTVTDTVVVPEVPKDCPRATGPTSSAAAVIVRKSFFMFFSPHVALIVKVSAAEKVPVLNCGSLLKEKFTETELGSVALQAPPPPVQALAGTLSTCVCAVLLTVCVPEHTVPNDAPLHVYVSAPEETDGPPAGENSAVACTVMVPPPVGVVRMR